MTQLSSVDKAAIHNGLKKKVRHLIGLLRSMEVKGGQSPQSVNCWTNIKKREEWTWEQDREGQKLQAGKKMAMTSKKWFALKGNPGHSYLPKKSAINLMVVLYQSVEWLKIEASIISRDRRRIVWKGARKIVFFWTNFVTTRWRQISNNFQQSVLSTPSSIPHLIVCTTIPVIVFACKGRNLPVEP